MSLEIHPWMIHSIAIFANSTQLIEPQREAGIRAYLDMLLFILFFYTVICS
jgi:hypothetical protein